jgi:hypothetical protein
MNGPGVMFYEKSGTVLFRGIFKSGNFFNGTLYTEDGTKLKDVVPSSVVKVDETAKDIDEELSNR